LEYVLKNVKCPLCGGGRNFLLKQYVVSELSVFWEKSFGFDPFDSNNSPDVFEKRKCANCALSFYFPEFYGDKDFYARLSKYPWYYEADKWEFDVALDLICKFKPKTLLEFGCGSGEFLAKVATGVERCVGLDINVSAIEDCKSKELIATSDPIDMIDEKFDMVVLFEVLEHLEEPAYIIEQLSERLNKGGLLVIAVPNPEGYIKDQSLVLLDLPPHHSTQWFAETFRFIENRFELKQVFYACEPIRYVHFQSHVIELIGNSSKSLFLNHIQKLIFKVLGPFFFDLYGNKVVGQTHLVALQKE
jgi:2-polyprenyl-3-methyl-5-hydroxy-6-metoxy-1,4-benzoquinol methylase